MAAKKTRKNTKTTGKKAQKPVGRLDQGSASPKKKKITQVRAKVRVKRSAAKGRRPSLAKREAAEHAPKPRKEPSTAEGRLKHVTKTTFEERDEPRRPSKPLRKAARDDRDEGQHGKAKALRKAVRDDRDEGQQGKAKALRKAVRDDRDERQHGKAKVLRKAARDDRDERQHGKAASDELGRRPAKTLRKAPPDDRTSGSSLDERKAKRKGAAAGEAGAEGRSTSGRRRVPSPSPSKRGSAPPARRSSPLREPPARIASLPLNGPIKRPNVEDRAASIETRLAAATDEFRRRYEGSLDMSWVYHDSALEGVVYTFEELRTALSGPMQPLTDSSMQPTYDDIRRHKEAIEFIRDFGVRKKLPVTVDIIKKIYLILHPEEGDIKTVKYRKDIPQHRLYFHEYAPPDKVAYKVRQIVDWLNDPETRKTRNGIRIAARAHYDLLRVYPFPTDSGKVARLFMNLLLMRSGMPPAIIHSTERQRYYEALKGSATTVLQMVQEAVENALSSVEKLLDEHETKKRAFVS